MRLEGGIEGAPAPDCGEHSWRRPRQLLCPQFASTDLWSAARGRGNNTAMLTLPFLPVGPRVSGLHSTKTPVQEDGYPARHAAGPLPAGSLFRLNGDQRGRVIHCRRGAVWVTQADDAQDHVLEAG